MFICVSRAAQLASLKINIKQLRARFCTFFLGSLIFLRYSLALFLLRCWRRRRQCASFA